MRYIRESGLDYDAGSVGGQFVLNLWLPEPNYAVMAGSASRNSPQGRPDAAPPPLK